MSNNDVLPITVKAEGLFEQNDKSSQFLVSKLEAWLNFQALCADWYANDKLVVKLNFTILPETTFYQHQLDANKTWQNLTTPLAVYHHDTNVRSFSIYLMLTKEDISSAMEAPQKVEEMLQTKLASTANQLISEYHLSAI